MRLKLRAEAELLSESQLDKLLQDALKIWKQIPFHIQGTDEFFDYLTDFGCKIDGEYVYFPQPVIDKVLGRIAEDLAPCHGRRARAPGPLHLLTPRSLSLRARWVASPLARQRRTGGPRGGRRGGRRTRRDAPTSASSPVPGVSGAP